MGVVFSIQVIRASPKRIHILVGPIRTHKYWTVKNTTVSRCVLDSWWRTSPTSHQNQPYIYQHEANARKQARWQVAPPENVVSQGRLTPSCHGWRFCAFRAGLPAVAPARPADPQTLPCRSPAPKKLTYPQQDSPSRSNRRISGLKPPETSKMRAKSSTSTAKLTCANCPARKKPSTTSCRSG